MKEITFKYRGKNETLVSTGEYGVDFLQTGGSFHEIWNKDKNACLKGQTPDGQNFWIRYRGHFVKLDGVCMNMGGMVDISAPGTDFLIDRVYVNTLYIGKYVR